MNSLFRTNYVKKIFTATAVFLSSESVAQANLMLLEAQANPHSSSNNHINKQEEFINTGKLGYICAHEKNRADTLFQNDPSTYQAFKNRCEWVFYSDYIDPIKDSFNSLLGNAVKRELQYFGVKGVRSIIMGKLKDDVIKDSKSNEVYAKVTDKIKEESTGIINKIKEVGAKVTNKIKSAAGEGIKFVKEHPIASGVLAVTLASGVYYYTDGTKVISAASTCDDLRNHFETIAPRSDAAFGKQHQKHISKLLKMTSEGNDFTKLLKNCAEVLYPLNQTTEIATIDKHGQSVTQTHL